MKQRKKQPDQTRQSILDAAQQEFSEKGYAGAGLGGIIALSGLTKGALFHHFQDKRALAKAWIEDRLAPGLTDLWKPADTIRSLSELQELCKTRLTGVHPTDPISALTLFAAETAARDEILGDALEAIFTSWRSTLTACIERGKSEGWIHHAIQPPLEAALLVSLFTGFSVTSKAAGGTELRRQSLIALEGYLETLRAQGS